MDGNTFFNINEPTFTHGEAVKVTGVSSRNLNNWIQRGVIDFGMMHRTGRRLFSWAELVLLKVIGDLTECISMPPAEAVLLAIYAKDRITEMTERDQVGNLIYKGLKSENRKYLVAWFDGNNHKADIVLLEDFFGKHSIPHAVVVLPLDDIILRVINKAVGILKEE